MVCNKALINQNVASMLKNSNHDIADIIFESGFGNISWASELFKKKYGMTMSEYRKEIYIALLFI